MAQRERTTDAAKGTNCPTCPQSNSKQVVIERRYYNKPPNQEVVTVSLADLENGDNEAETETQDVNPKQALFDEATALGIKFKKTQSAETIKGLIDAYKTENNV
jgi:hypothetical protein